LWLDEAVFSLYHPGMGKKPMTVAEMASMGGPRSCCQVQHRTTSKVRKECRPTGEAGPEGARNAEKAAGNRHDSG